MFFSPLLKSKLSFEGERSYENVIALLYRHWIVIFLRLLFYGVLFFLPLIISLVFGTYIGKLGLASLFRFVASLYYLIWWNGVFFTITMYLLDTWVITDHRILDNQQHGFFKRTLTEAGLSKIQDQSVEIKGLIPTFFDYGNLEIQTAGTIPKITMGQIPHPNEVKALINKTCSDFSQIHKDGVEVHEKTEL